MDILTVFLLIAFFLRAYFTFCCNNFSPKSFTSDENGHLAHERLLAQGNNLTTYLKEHLFNRTVIGYPNLFHYISRFLFKEDYSLHKRRYLSGVFSLLFPILFFTIGLNYYKYDVVAFTTIALLLSLSTFGLFIKQYKAYTGRSLADFILMAGYFFVVLYYQTNEIVFYILAILSFSLVWFTSEFGMQSVLITPIFWSVLSGSTLPIEISVLSIVLAIIISKEKVSNNLSHKIFHWIWYFRNQSFLHEKKKIKITNLKSFYHKVTSNIIYGKLLQFIPFLPVFLFYSIYDFKSDIFINSLILSTIIIAILTVGKTLSFLGPSFRYILYATPFLWMLLYQENSYLAIVILLIESVISFILTLFVMKQLKNNKRSVNYKELDDIFKIVDTKDNKILLSPVNLNQSFFSRSNNIKGMYISIWDNDFDPYALHFHEKYMSTYPYLNNSYDDLMGLKKETLANILVIDKIYTKDVYDNGFLNKLLSHKILFQSERFLVVEL